MGHSSYIAAAAAIAVTITGCGDPSSPRYGNPESYFYPSAYSYYPSGPTYSPRLRSDDYRSYNGIHPAAESALP